MHVRVSPGYCVHAYTLMCAQEHMLLCVHVCLFIAYQGNFCLIAGPLQILVTVSMWEQMCLSRVKRVKRITAAPSCLSRVKCTSHIVLVLLIYYIPYHELL